MKLVILLSIAALVACDYSAPQPEKPSDAYAPPDKVETIEEPAAPVETGKLFLRFSNFNRGAFPPARFAFGNFFSLPSFNYPLKGLNLAVLPQGILPSVSQIVPPQLPHIGPPFPQIVPPIFGNAKPVLPAPSPITPPQVFPSISQPLLSKFSLPSLPHYASLNQYPFAFPSGFSFFSSPFFLTQIQKQPTKTQSESLSTSYGPPVSGPVEPEPAGPAETSAPFEPSPPVSFPYEPAAPEAAEPAAPHKPAQEYGPPSLN